jgi:hypothetical protein
VLTISKLKRWSINYYIDTASTAERAAKNRQRANGGLVEYYSERETRTPIWLCAGNSRAAAALFGLTDTSARAGRPTRWWRRAGSMTGPRPTVRGGAHSGCAVCTASI